LRGYEAEACSGCGIHPSTWHPDHGGDIRRPEFVPEWKYCKTCDMWQRAEAAGPPPGKNAKGWVLSWVRPLYDKP